MLSKVFQRSLIRSPLVNLNARYFAAIRKFSAQHEWIEYDKDTKVGVVGITSFAQGELGDIVHVEIPPVG